MAAIAQEATGGTPQSQPVLGPDDIPKGLAVWREAVNRASTSAQLAMCLYTLEASIAWDKSIMKAVSQSHVFSKQRARKYNSKLSVGACAFLVSFLTPPHPTSIYHYFILNFHMHGL